MAIHRIIFFLAITSVIENQAAPYARSEFMCSEFNRRYVFLLNAAAYEADLLTNLVQSTKSARVKSSGSKNDVHQVTVSLEDFEDFKRESENLKLYTSHSLQCGNPARNFIKPNGTASEYSSTEVTTLILPKLVTALAEKMGKNSHRCEPQSEKKCIKKLAALDMEQSLEPTASVSVISIGSGSSSRASRASKVIANNLEKETSNRKSKKKSMSKFPEGRTATKLLIRNKFLKNIDTGRTKKKSKTKVTNMPKTLISTRKTLTLEPWNRLLSMAEKSLTKSNNSSVKSTHGEKKIHGYSNAAGKLLSSAKVGNTQRARQPKNKLSKQANIPDVKNSRKSGSKTSVTRRPKSLTIRNRVNQQGKSTPKRQRRASLSIKNSRNRKMSVVNNHRENRERRELRISAIPSMHCGENYTGTKTSTYVDEEVTIDVPIACMVIKISNTCEPDCSEDNQEISEGTTQKVPGDTPILSPETDFKPTEPSEEVTEESTVKPVPIESTGDQPDELFERVSTKPDVILPRPEEGKEYQIETSTNLIDATSLPDELPYVATDRPDLIQPVTFSYLNETVEYPFELSTEPNDGIQISEEPSNRPIDYEGLSTPNFNEYSTTASPVAHPIGIEEHPIEWPPGPDGPSDFSSPDFSNIPSGIPPPLMPDNMAGKPGPPQGYLRQSVGGMWPRPPSSASSASLPAYSSPTSHDSGTFGMELPVLPGSLSRKPYWPVDRGPKPSVVPFEDQEGVDNEMDDVNYDGDDDEEYDEGLAEHGKNNGLTVSAPSLQSKITPDNKMEENKFSLRNKSTKTGEGAGIENNYDDEDYDVEDYNEYNENLEDYVEESKNGEINVGEDSIKTA